MPAEQPLVAGAAEQKNVGATLPLGEALPTVLSMAQIATAMEVALQDLRRLQACRAALDPADLEAWEHDLQGREVEF